MRHDGKTALVTGASSGIGRSVALKLAADGANVVIHYNARKDAAEEVANQIVGMGRKAVVIQGDMADASVAEKAVNTTVSELGRIDILSTNAGVIGPMKPFWQVEQAEWDECIDVNLRGVFLCNKYAALKMIDQKAGRIVNTASIFGKKGWPNYGVYAATKAGIIMFTQSAANDLAPHGITVNCVCPGVTDTAMLDYETEHWAKEYGLTIDQMEAEWVKNIPLGRMQTADEQAGIVSWIASDEAAYLTGVSLSCAGGMEMN
ncbi:MAG: 3-oxoacyl-ACP reductase family protein [Pseudomonadota bacterium]